MRTKTYSGVYEGSGQPVTIYCQIEQRDVSSYSGREFIDGFRTMELRDGSRLNRIEVTSRGELKLQVVSTGEVVLIPNYKD